MRRNTMRTMTEIKEIYKLGKRREEIQRYLSEIGFTLSRSNHNSSVRIEVDLMSRVDLRGDITLLKAIERGYLAELEEVEQELRMKGIVDLEI